MLLQKKRWEESVGVCDDEKLFGGVGANRWVGESVSVSERELRGRFANQRVNRHNVLM